MEFVRMTPFEGPVVPLVYIMIVVDTCNCIGPQPPALQNIYGLTSASLAQFIDMNDVNGFTNISESGRIRFAIIDNKSDGLASLRTRANTGRSSAFVQIPTHSGSLQVSQATHQEYIYPNVQQRMGCKLSFKLSTSHWLCVCYAALIISAAFSATP